jgi:uncharacterized membrane protein
VQQVLTSTVDREEAETGFKAGGHSHTARQFLFFNIIIMIVLDGNTMQLSSRLVAFTAVISALTVALSFLTVPFLFGTRIHFFQAGILLAGVAGGPLSGLITGSVGGLYVAAMTSDPTIVLGNGLLGLFAGIFSRKLRPVFAGLLAWGLIQAPWIYVTGTLIFHVPEVGMQAILLLLTVEDVICASVIDVLATHFHLRDFLLGREKHA